MFKKHLLSQTKHISFNNMPYFGQKLWGGFLVIAPNPFIFVKGSKYVSFVKRN
jgi:hypothetical protein